MERRRGGDIWRGRLEIILPWGKEYMGDREMENKERRKSAAWMTGDCCEETLGGCMHAFDQ